MNTPYALKDDLKEAIESSEYATVELFQCFFINQMKHNPDKCCLITSKSEGILVNTENIRIKNRKCKKLLSVENRL